jgi:hypothetical protein
MRQPLPILNRRRNDHARIFGSSTDEVRPMPEYNDGSPFEKHYRIGELARLWGLGRETVRKLVKRRSRRDKNPGRQKEGAYDLQRSGIGRTKDTYASVEQRLARRP